MRRFMTLTDEEIGRAIAQTREYGKTASRSTPRQQMWEALFLLLANLGLRITEAITLTWDKVDLERGEVTVRTLKQRPRKGKSPDDTLPLDRATRAALAAWKDGGAPTDRIFPVSRRSAYNVWQRLLHRAGIRPIKMHCLRHSAITRWLKQTGDLAFARGLARHSSLATTSLYTHCDDLKAQLEKVKPIG